MRYLVGMMMFALAACSSGNAGIEDTYWKLTALNGAPVIASEQSSEASMTFSSSAARASGSTGCNRYNSGYTLAGNQVKFAMAASTMMACVHGMQSERIFLDTLPLITQYTVKDDVLVLRDATGAARMQFIAATKRD